MPPDNREVRQPGQSTNQAARQELSAREIQERLVEEIRQIGDDELGRRRLAEKIKNAVRDAEIPASEQRRSTELRTQGAQSEVSQTERQRLKADVVRVLKAVEQGVIEVPSPSNKKLLTELNERLGTGVTDTNAAFLQPIVAKLIETNQTVDDLKLQFDTLRFEWGPQGHEFIQRVSDSIIETARAGQLAVDERRAQELFSSATRPPQDNNPSESSGDLRVFEQDWEYYYRNFFGSEDRPVLQALYSVEKLDELVETIKSDVQATAQADNLTPEQMNKKVSAALEEKIVLTYSNMYSRIDRARADKTFEEIEQEGSLYSSIRAVESQFKGALQLMVTKIRRATDLPEQLRELQLYQRYSVEGLREKNIPIHDPREADGEHKLQLQYKITPVTDVEPVSLANFLESLLSEVEHENNMRRYLHNIQSLFLRPAGEGGFWGSVGNYSEQVKSEDIDAMMLLPDSDKLIAAYRLYVKYLEEEFAVVDWVHQPGMFADDFFHNKSKIQQNVLEDLKRMFPELASEANSWRLQRALSMGVGLAKGIYLTEAEIAAYADPHINVQSGGPTFTSYYTNDSAATEPLNPLHSLLRWQAEAVTMGPLIYMPVNAFDKKLLRNWNHNVLWKKMKEFRDSFERGQVAFNGDKNDKLFGQMLVDILPNYGKGGSFITRGGWRMTNATEGWLYDKDGHELSMLDKIKALEYIGYEAIKSIDVVGSKHHPKPFDVKNPVFEYLGRKYLGSELHGNVGSYIDSLPGEDRLDKEKLFMATIHSRLLFQRLPTKFIRLERDRTSATGKSLWKMVRESMGNMDARDFDRLMKQLSFVEVAKRNEVSQEMKAFLEQQPGKEKDLSTFSPSSNYVVDENAIRRYITNPEEQNSVVRLYEAIQSVMHREKTLDKVALQLNGSGYPFSIGAEELDTSFIALRNAGPRVLARSLKDTGQIETVVTKNLKEFLGALHHVSIGNHDFSPLVKHIAQMKNTLESVHGHHLAGKIAQYMATLTVAYFKKDDVARKWHSKALAIGRPNSLAAEFAGTWRGVWEWDVEDVDKFITTLERERIVAKNGAYDLAYQGAEVPEVVPKKFLGVRYGRIKHDDEGFMTGKSLRDMLGATKKDIALDSIYKFAPIFALYVIFAALQRALKEEGGKGGH